MNCTNMIGSLSISDDVSYYLPENRFFSYDRIIVCSPSMTSPHDVIPPLRSLYGFNLKRTYGEYNPVVECKGMANVAHHYVLIQSQCHSTGEYCDSEGMNTGSMRQEEREWQLWECSSEVVCKTTADRDSCAVSKSQREW